MNERIWSTVDAALDARRDPRLEGAIAARMAEDPAFAAELERLCARLDLLPELPAAPAARPWTLAASLAAAALLVVLIGRATFLRADANGSARALEQVTLVIERTTPPPPRLARTELTTRRVVAWTLEGDTP